MSQQLLETLTFLDQQSVDSLAELFVDGISSVLGQIECTDAEKVVLTSLAVACTKPNMQYNADLARDVKGRELATVAVIDILLQVVHDDTCDYPSRLLAQSLVRELDAILKIVDVLEDDPMHSARMLLDGPLP
jgi:hypothetical protein